MRPRSHSILHRRVPRITVHYNTQFGFVEHALIDYDEGTNTDDVIYNVTEYTPGE